MRWMIILFFSFSGAAFAAPADPVAEARGAALQADTRRALALLEGVDAAGLPEKERNFVTCVRSRFSTAKPATTGGSNFADRALAIYQAYWHSALIKPETRRADELRLEANLRRLLHARSGTKMDRLELLLEKRLLASGWHSLEGRTGLLRELMIWGKQDEKTVPVALPEGEFDSTVFYLDGFKSFGWSHYATCGRAATGGWATDTALYAVVPRYDSLENEQFKVTFLGHETQHFADKRRFKDLKPWELEYRAKLVEVSLADVTRTKVLDSFASNQGDDPSDPHSYADRKVLVDLVKQLGIAGVAELYGVDLGRLQSAARAVLQEDSRRRQASSQSAAK